MIFSDCDSVLQKVKKRVECKLRYALDNDIDAILKIRQMIQGMQCHIRLEYVKSQQDNHVPFQDATFPQQLNILMDEAISKFIDKSIA